MQFRMAILITSVNHSVTYILPLSHIPDLSLNNVTKSGFRSCRSGTDIANNLYHITKTRGTNCEFLKFLKFLNGACKDEIIMFIQYHVFGYSVFCLVRINNLYSLLRAQHPYYTRKLNIWLASICVSGIRAWWQTHLHRQPLPPHRTQAGSSLYQWRIQGIMPQPTLTSRLSK